MLVNIIILLWGKAPGGFTRKTGHFLLQERWWTLYLSRLQILISKTISPKLAYWQEMPRNKVPVDPYSLEPDYSLRLLPVEWQCYPRKFGAAFSTCPIYSWGMLRYAQSLEVTDPRDRINATLNLAIDYQDDGVMNYEKSLTDMCNGLRFLAQVKLSRNLDLTVKDLPSWAPNWNHSRGNSIEQGQFTLPTFGIIYTVSLHNEVRRSCPQRCYKTSQTAWTPSIEEFRNFYHLLSFELGTLNLDSLSTAVFWELLDLRMSCVDIFSRSCNHWGRGSSEYGWWIWTLFGCPTPTVLRRDGSCFVVVSPAYVHNMMNGQTVDEVFGPDKYNEWPSVLKNKQFSPWPKYSYVSGKGKWLVQIISLR